MQPAEHDPLQFGAAEEQVGDVFLITGSTSSMQGQQRKPACADTSDADRPRPQAAQEDLPAAYGTSSDPLAPTPPQQQQQQQHQPAQSWQRYPDPAPSAPEAAAATTAFSGSQQQQQQHASSSSTHYPNVPAPEAVNYQISLGSAGSGGSGSLGGGGSTQATPRSPNAATTLGLATALSSMPASNPALRIVVLNPLRHMGPSGIPGLEEAYISYEVVTTTSLPHFSGGRLSVRRRFRDVVSLSNLLPKLLHGRCVLSGV